MTSKKGKTASFYFPAEAVAEQEYWERLPQKGQWVVEKLREEVLHLENHIVKRLDEIEKEKAELEARLEKVKKNRIVMRSKLTDEQMSLRHENIIRRLFVEAYDGNTPAFKELGDKGIRDGDVTQDEIDKVLVDVQKKKDVLKASEPAAAVKMPKKEKEAVKEGAR